MNRKWKIEVGQWRTEDRRQCMQVDNSFALAPLSSNLPATTSGSAIHHPEWLAGIIRYLAK
jgi:hypothetical protein